MLLLVQMYNTNLSFLLRGDSYFAGAYYFYCFCQCETCFYHSGFQFVFFLSFIIHLSFVEKTRYSRTLQSQK